MVTRKRKSDLIDDDEAESDQEDANQDDNQDPNEEESPIDNASPRYFNSPQKGHVKNQESLVSFKGSNTLSSQCKCKFISF